jgi:methionyl aminopeptidase
LRNMIGYLIKKKNVRSYPILVEGNNKIVSQAEHTFFIMDDSIYIITK